ncbi:malonyl-CoA decarboxylase family protein [Blastomonas sp.]|uniref:malonyl-CoA decarboxylase domain-containing protein n=1 Tax=Blastomonas sp. TaxID=1909299 RepID=UPI002612FBCC|nr:malonyl-CoA decarboxylase family protein [Blastomonas sp.]MDM7955758.1 malonyl-CoA decarboxylase family protein [Blastomonas sp.]
MPDLLARVQQLSLGLLESCGETQGTLTATRLAEALATLDEAAEIAYSHWLVEQLGPDPATLGASVDQWLKRPDAEGAAQLTRSAEPRRQELLRRLNAAPCGTRHLVTWRARLLQQLSQTPALAPLEADLKHLLASWFNRGFLELRPITWDSPARLLERLIEHEAVHNIAGWSDLRGRLEGDRRCYGFFHPALPDTPLIFVEVALTDHVSCAIAPLLDHPAHRSPPDQPSTAIFYSISNCEPGLRGLQFGNFLIKQIVADLKVEYPSLTTFATLSPIPGLTRWLKAGGRDLGRDGDDPRRLCALYLTGAKPDGSPGKASDPVAAFHLGNGAELWRINSHADPSAKGLAQSEGMMVNYVYREQDLINNHEQFAQHGRVTRSREVSALIAGPATPAWRWTWPWGHTHPFPHSQEKSLCR